MITQAMEPLVTRVLPRGNWQDESGEVVEPAVPHFLPQPAAAEGRRLTRLDLANWLTSPENPLTARVFMNRLWKQFFGAGISAWSTTSAPRASGRSIRSCSTGWPSSSATAAGTSSTWSS